MNNKLAMAAVAAIAILVLLGGGYFFLNSRQAATQTTATENEQQTSEEGSIAEPTDESIANAETVEIELTSSGFSPEDIEVEAGTTVLWTNNSGRAATVDSAPHPVHTSMPEANLGSFNDGETLEFTFKTAGTYNYHNHLEASQRGSVTIK